MNFIADMTGTHRYMPCLTDPKIDVANNHLIFIKNLKVIKRDQFAPRFDRNGFFKT